MENNGQQGTDHGCVALGSPEEHELPWGWRRRMWRRRGRQGLVAIQENDVLPQRRFWRWRPVDGEQHQQKRTGPEYGAVSSSAAIRTAAPAAGLPTRIYASDHGHPP